MNVCMYVCLYAFIHLSVQLLNGFSDEGSIFPNGDEGDRR